MIEVRYFVPKDKKELKSLVGKSVAVSPTRDRERAVFPMTLHKIDESEYEFLIQLVGNRKKPIKKVKGYRVSLENMEFQDNAVVILPETYKPQFYTSRCQGYQERAGVLKHNNLWREPTQ